MKSVTVNAGMSKGRVSKEEPSLETALCELLPYKIEDNNYIADMLLTAAEAVRWPGGNSDKRFAEVCFFVPEPGENENSEFLDLGFIDHPRTNSDSAIAAALAILATQHIDVLVLDVVEK